MSTVSAEGWTKLSREREGLLAVELRGGTADLILLKQLSIY